jgi:hypothetical protein
VDDTIDVNFDTDCEGSPPTDAPSHLYVQRNDPTDPTRKGNYYVKTTVEADTTCGTCKKHICTGTTCTAVYRVQNRKGSMLGYRCLGECTDGKRIRADELPPGVVRFGRP